MKKRSCFNFQCVVAAHKLQVVLPALAGCHPTALAAVQSAREAIDRARHERALRDIELWSTMYEQPESSNGAEEITCGICLCDIDQGESVRKLNCPGAHVFHRLVVCLA